MTLVLKLDLDMVKMYHHTKNEVSMLRHSKVIVQTDTHTHIDTQMDRQTHRQYENITFPHMRAVKITLFTGAALGDLEICQVGGGGTT